MYVDDISFSRATSILIQSDADYDSIRKIIEKKVFKTDPSEEEEAIMAHSTVHYQITDTKKYIFLRETPLEIFFTIMNAPITKEDFIRKLWFSRTILFDGDIVHTACYVRFVGKSTA